MGKRKYNITNGWWVYVHRTPDGMYYVGYSGGEDGNKQPNERWQPYQYQHTTLLPYIENGEWANIQHLVIKDGLTEDEAKHWENRLICIYRSIGRCLNKQRSGGITKQDNYKKTYYQEHRNELLEKTKKYQEEHKDERKQYKQKYYQEHQEELKTVFKKRNQTPEGKIYNRVTNYNRLHPNQIKETPLEAKQKYLEYGYILDYIKNNDIR